MIPNPIDAAVLRVECAEERYRIARAFAGRVLDDANEEWEAAHHNLKRFQSYPGIDKPEFRHWDILSDEDRRLYLELLNQEAAPGREYPFETEEECNGANDGTCPKHPNVETDMDQWLREHGEVADAEFAAEEATWD